MEMKSAPNVEGCVAKTDMEFEALEIEKVGCIRVIIQGNAPIYRCLDIQQLWSSWGLCAPLPEKICAFSHHTDMHYRISESYE